jgi:hypothetical protein
MLQFTKHSYALAKKLHELFELADNVYCELRILWCGLEVAPSISTVVDHETAISVFLAFSKDRAPPGLLRIDQTTYFGCNMDDRDRP